MLHHIKIKSIFESGGRLPWWRSLSVRLGASVLAVLCLALATFALLLNHLDERRILQQHTEHAGQTAAMVAHSLSQRMLAGGGAAVWRDVTDLSEELRRAVGAARIQVLSRDGRVMTATGTLESPRQYRLQDNKIRSAPAAMRPFPSATEFRAADGSRLLRVISPIPKPPACVRCHSQPEAFRGMIAIDFDLAPAERAAAQRNWLMLAIAAASGLAMLSLVVLLLRYLVNKPVRALAEAASAITRGDMGTRIPVRRSDEFGLLARSFNQMAAQIEEQMEAMKHTSSELGLLYAIMVEASRSLHMTDVQAIVLMILRDRLPLSMLVFCVESGKEGWCCSVAGAGGDEPHICGTGSMEECPALARIPQTLVGEACAQRMQMQYSIEGQWYFVIPFFDGERLTGLLAGYGFAAEALPLLDDKLLRNLSAHIGLALQNARHYTDAITDGLTGLRAKNYGLARLNEAIHYAERHAVPLGVLMLDLDHFKAVNDNHGHQAGDRVLREISARLLNRARKSDILVRYGGEEFMIILPDADAVKLAEVAEAIRACIAASPVMIDQGNTPLNITVSVGGALLCGGENRAEDIIGRADEALYRAKESGRNRVVIAGMYNGSISK
ncbi:MAG: GGDEF domain-containing protein [Sulfuricella sp.]